MQVILHLGVHCTDEDRLLKTLLRNADTWRHEGVAIPGPSRYRTLLSDTISALADTPPSPEAREVVLDAILSDDPDKVDRLILSHSNFFSVPKLTFAGGYLYRWAERRLETFCDLFDQDEVELFIGLRNPATFIPALLADTPAHDLPILMEGADPMHLRWSDLIRRIRIIAPEVPVTVWANEDTPFIWGEILRRMAGVPLDRKITGAFDMFASIISREGMQRFRAFLAENPTINEDQKRQAMMVLLDRFALDEVIEQELDLPGWDAAYVDMLTELYEDDIEVIAEIEDVTLIRP
jgi:hypothetical protein